MPRTTHSRKLKPTIQVSCEPKSSPAQKPYIGDTQCLNMKLYIVIFKVNMIY